MNETPKSPTQQPLLLRQKLSVNLNIKQIHEIYASLQSDISLLETLCAMSCDEDPKISVNALWVMTHFSKEDTRWLLSKYDFLIDSVLQTTDEESGKRRMLLSILTKHNFEEENIRTDFLDYCLKHIIMAKESTANRCRCMELAYKQCRFYPELIRELETILETAGDEPMLPAINCTRTKVLKLINKTRKQ